MNITVKINGQAVSVDVTIEVYECIQGFDRKAENLMHQKCRHWDMRELDEYIIANECSRVHALIPEQILCRQETLNQILTALRVCTETHQKRFLIYALEDMSCEDIERLQGCSKISVYESIMPSTNLSDRRCFTMPTINLKTHNIPKPTGAILKRGACCLWGENRRGG